MSVSVTKNKVMSILLCLYITGAVAQLDFPSDVNNRVLWKKKKWNHNIILNNVKGQEQESTNLNDILNLKIRQNEERVKIQFFYESLCPGSRQFYTLEFKETVEKLNSFLDIYTYPFGNAKIIEKDNQTEVECQHGPEECYGNKLHACALDYLTNKTQAILYNACMMDPSQPGDGSDDAAADTCGISVKINSGPIKECAKSDKGEQFLLHYGEETKKMKNMHYVPYVLINGVESLDALSHFMEYVCKAFKKPPSPCNK